MIRHLKFSDRNQTIELVNQFFKQINTLKLDGVFKIKPRAATKMVDIYFKLQETNKVLLLGYFLEDELVSLVICKTEERPYLEEEKILYIDLAVTKLGKMNQGYMKKLYKTVVEWAKQKKFRVIELRAINENKQALEFWNHLGFDSFYTRFRKLI